MSYIYILSWTSTGVGYDSTAQGNKVYIYIYKIYKLEIYLVVFALYVMNTLSTIIIYYDVYN